MTVINNVVCVCFLDKSMLSVRIYGAWKVGPRCSSSITKKVYSNQDNDHKQKARQSRISKIQNTMAKNNYKQNKAMNKYKDKTVTMTVRQESKT